MHGVYGENKQGIIIKVHDVKGGTDDQNTCVTSRTCFLTSVAVVEEEEAGGTNKNNIVNNVWVTLLGGDRWGYARRDIMVATWG